MRKHTIKMTFDQFSWMQPLVAFTIRRCINATLEAEGIHIPCEINVLVTNDEGIHGINKATRDVDRPTDVLSFPMFQLEPGNPPKDWEEYLDYDTGRCPLGDMCISLERAIAQAKEFGHSTKREVGYLTNPKKSIPQSTITQARGSVRSIGATQKRPTGRPIMAIAEKIVPPISSTFKSLRLLIFLTSTFIITPKTFYPLTFLFETALVTSNTTINARKSTADTL